jgi:ribosomal protein S18 acetylase RimI-like enzyme
MPCELANKPLMQKSLVARRRIRKGEVIAADALACKRPAAGLDPSWFDAVVGQRAAEEIPAETLITPTHLAQAPARVVGLEPRWQGALADLFRALRDAGDERLFHPHPLTDAEAARLARHRGRDLYCVLVEGGAVLGYGMLRGWDEGFDVPSLGVAIHPSARGRGYGERLTRFLHDEARRRGAARVRLKVHPDNAGAMRLYRRLGYVFQGEEHGQRVGVLEFAPAASPSGEASR